MLLAALGADEAPRVFVDVAAARGYVERGAVVLDARKDPEAPYLPNARPLDWMDVRDGFGRTGKLAETKALVRALEAAGVDSDRPVLIYGDASEGWGEEGRLWWMLAYLGHPEARILDGGLKAWRRAGAPLSAAPVAATKKGRFVAHPRPRLRADYVRTNRIRKLENGRVLDVRTREEFRGQTPYWSWRGGHIPGARNLTWRGLFDDDGRVLPRRRLRALLLRAGLDPSAPTVAYCTGGVRSAFMVAALVEAGWEDVANYDGSWWDWSARTRLPVTKEPRPTRREGLR